MKHKTRNLFAICLAIFVFSIFGFAQDKKNERAATAASSIYVISAKAGAVNFVSGSVTSTKKNSRTVNLQKGDNLEIGDKVSTGAEGKAEILLNPGSYVRLAENSEFEFKTTSLDDLQLKLTAGSSIFEVIADKDFKISINTGKSKFYLVKSGVYRIDVSTDGFGKISVWKGKAQIGDSNGTIVKGGKSASIVDGQIAVVKFDRDNKDNLDVWSKSRAKEIAKINDKLIQREMNRSLLNSFNRSGSSNFGGYGVWVFDAGFRGYCFLPFSYGWSSPYGYGYNQSIWNYSVPAAMFYNTRPNVGNPNIQQNPNGNNPIYSPPIQTPPMQTPSSPGMDGRVYTPSAPSNNTRVYDQPTTRPSIVDRKLEMPDNGNNRRID